MFQALEYSDSQFRLLYLSYCLKLVFKVDSKKSFQDKYKLKTFITIKSAQQKIFVKVLYREKKRKKNISKRQQITETILGLQTNNCGLWNEKNECIPFDNSSEYYWTQFFNWKTQTHRWDGKIGLNYRFPTRNIPQ